MTRAGRQLSWYLPHDSSPGLFFRCRFNLKSDNPLCAHRDWEGWRDGPSKALLHFHPDSVKRAFYFLFFCLSTPIHANYSILHPIGIAPRCRGPLKSSISQLAIKCLINLWRCLLFRLLFSDTCGLPCSFCPTGPAWVDTRCYHWPDQIFLSQTSWGQMIPESKLIGKRAWLVWKERGRIRCAGRQSKLLATRSRAPAWSPSRARTSTSMECWNICKKPITLKANAQGDRVCICMIHAVFCLYAHSPEHGGFISGNSLVRLF